MYKIYKYLSIITLKLVYHTFIQPYTSYGIEAWYNADQTCTNNVFIMQEKVNRLISKIGYREYTNSYFKAMNILKLDNLFKIQICSYLYKKFYCNYDDILKNKTTIPPNIHLHNTRNNSHFSVKRFNRSKSQ